MKSMAFIDHQNFDIAKVNFLSQNGEKFNIDYSKLTSKLNSKISLQSTLIKTFLFAYRPCKDLLKLDHYNKYYNWLCSLKNKSYFEVIEGTQEIRPNGKDPIDINDTATYKTKEKGTDINLAVNMLSKAYQNAYDIAILISGDTDYIPVVKELHNLGKIVILATLPNQNTSKYDELKDAHIKIDLDLLKDCKITTKRDNSNE